MTSKEMKVFQANLKQVEKLRQEIKNSNDAITILRKENEELRENQRRTAARSNRRKKQLCIFNRRMRDLSIAKRLEGKLERFIRDILDRYGVSDDGDKAEPTITRVQGGWFPREKPIVFDPNTNESVVVEPQPIATGNLSVVTESPETIIEPTEPPIQTRGRAMWRNPIDITRPAAHVHHTDGICETCGYNPCRCSKEF